MIQFIHTDIKEKESRVNNLLETTLIYSKKQAHIYIYISDKEGCEKYDNKSGSYQATV